MERWQVSVGGRRIACWTMAGMRPVDESKRSNSGFIVERYAGLGDPGNGVPSLARSAEIILKRAGCRGIFPYESMGTIQT